mmetsp:Transcript_32173/g.44870  ORF Transcript_32173/g.44870 Transcript_32173/m.44870 type:complete len:229 (-) Transcript_32173:119-805(-)
MLALVERCLVALRLNGLDRIDLRYVVLQHILDPHFESDRRRRTTNAASLQLHLYNAVFKPSIRNVPSILLHGRSNAAFQQLFDHRHHFIVVIVYLRTCGIFDILLIRDHRCSALEKFHDLRIHFRLYCVPLFLLRDRDGNEVISQENIDDSLNPEESFREGRDSCCILVRKIHRTILEDHTAWVELQALRIRCVLGLDKQRTLLLANCLPISTLQIGRREEPPSFPRY